MKRKKKGVTLVEVVISLAILGIISSTIFVALSKSNSNNVVSKEKQEAKSVGQSVMEKITSQKSIKNSKIDDNLWIKGDKSPYEIEGVVDGYKINGKIQNSKKKDEDSYLNTDSDMFINVYEDNIKFFFRECNIESIKSKRENFAHPKGIFLQKIESIKIYQRRQYFSPSVLIRGVEITFKNTNYNNSVLSVYGGQCYNDYCEESQVVSGQLRSSFMFGKSATKDPLGIEIKDTNIPIYIDNDVPEKKIKVFNYTDKKDLDKKQNLKKYLDTFNNNEGYELVNDSKSEDVNVYASNNLYIIDINVCKGEKNLQSVTGSYLEGEN